MMDRTAADRLTAGPAGAPCHAASTTSRLLRPRALYGGEDGFALVVALLTLVALTALATVGLLLSGPGPRVVQTPPSTTKAFYASEAGLQDFLGTHCGPVTGDTTLYQLDEHTIAYVHATPLLQVADQTWLHRVTSRGLAAAPRRGIARRTLSVVAMAVPAGDCPGASRSDASQSEAAAAAASQAVLVAQPGSWFEAI